MNIKIITISTVLALISLSVSAEETICPKPVNPSWDKMKESDFTKEKVQKQLKLLQEFFNGNEVVAEEFVYQSLLIIEGGALRGSVDYWKKEGNQQNVKHWTNEFCKFMKKAYLVH